MARVKHETPRAAAAFQIYAAMGMGRSIVKLHRELQANLNWSSKVPALRRLEEWSSAHKWQERVKAYDAERIEEDRLAKEALKEQTNREHYDLGLTATQVAVNTINNLIEREKFGSQAAVQLLKLATDLQRLALGMDKPEFDRGPQVAGIQIIIETDNTPVAPIIESIPDAPRISAPDIIEGKTSDADEHKQEED